MRFAHAAIVRDVRLRARMTLAATVLALGLLGAPAAHAAPGDLTQIGCIGGLTGCFGVNPASTTGGAFGLALSPDGGRLYLGAHFGTLDRFTPDGGPLQMLAGCTGNIAGCGTTVPATALNGTRGLALSADGRHLYVAAYGGTVSHLTLDASGIPTFAGCIGNLAGCTATAPADALRQADHVALSPNGRDLYAAAEGSGTLSHFTLDASGVPTFAGCVGGLAGCTAPSVPHALDGAQDLVVSPDGRQLYVTSSTFTLGQGQALSSFALDAGGVPTFSGCFGNTPGCTAVDPDDAVYAAHGIALSRDGRRLYVGANQDVAQFDVDGAGTLGYAGCVGNLSGCAPIPDATPVFGVFGVALSPDGTQLYASSYGSSTLDRFTLGADGRPSFAGCLGSTMVPCTPVTPARALDGAYGMLPSPDGARLYVASYNAGVVAQFAVERPPPPAPPAPPAPGPPGPPGVLFPAPDRTAPALSGYALSRTRFAAAARGARSAARRRRAAAPKVGTTIRYALSEPATVTFTVERSAGGRRAGGRCVAPSRRNRRAARCTRVVALRGSFAHTGAAGRASVPFDGRLGGRKLAPGSYRLVARARDKAGNVSAPARAAFAIVALRR